MAQNHGVDFDNVLDQLLLTLRSSILQEYQKAVLGDAISRAVETSTHQGSGTALACWPCGRDEMKFQVDLPQEPIPVNISSVSKTEDPDPEPVAIDESEVHGLAGIRSASISSAICTASGARSRPTGFVQPKPISHSDNDCAAARIFESLDKDMSGKIELRELRPYLQVNDGVSEQKLLDALRDLDSDGDKSLDKQEAINLVSKLESIGVTIVPHSDVLVAVGVKAARSTRKPAFDTRRSLAEKIGKQAVKVNRAGLVQRLELELELAIVCRRLCVFLLYVLPFAAFIMAVKQPVEVGNAHKSMMSQYGLESPKLAAISSWDQVYGFMQVFTEANDLLQPTGLVYWCDPRFLDLPLGVTAAGDVEYLRQAELLGSASTSAGNAHRRLASSESATSSNTTTSATCPASGQESLEHKLLNLKLAYQNPTPLGIDAEGHDMTLYDCSYPSSGDLLSLYHNLQDEQRSNAVPVLDYGPRRRRSAASGHRRLAGTVLESNTSWTYLASQTGPKAEYQHYFDKYRKDFTNYNVKLHDYETSSYPETSHYLPRYRYPYKQVSIIEPLIYQKRLKATACKGKTFSDIYAHQISNPDGPYGQNAPRATDILECFDEIQKDDVADDIDTKGYKYQEGTVYGRFAKQSGDHTGGSFDDWQRIGWLDKLTSKVTISALVYTQAIELFTLVSVIFEQGAGGTVHATLKMDSMFDLSHGNLDIILGCGICGAVFSFLAIIQTVHHISKVVSNEQMLETCKDRLLFIFSKRGHDIFELFTRLALFSYLVVYMVSISTMDPIQAEFEDVMNTFLNLHDFSHQGVQKAIQHTFEVKEMIDTNVSIEYMLNMMGIVVFLVQACQLLVYVSSHPRLGILMSTLNKTLDDMLHFTILFLAMYVLLGFIGHVSFAATCPDQFGTFTSSLKKQFEIICGYGDDWPFRVFDTMDSLESMMFQVYLGVYVLLVFFIMLNFFVGIVLQGFFDTKKDIEAMISERSFFFDMADVGFSAWAFRKHRWPRRADVVQKIKECKSVGVSPGVMQRECDFFEDDTALAFLTYYCRKQPELVEEEW